MGLILFVIEHIFKFSVKRLIRCVKSTLFARRMGGVVWVLRLGVRPDLSTWSETATTFVYELALRKLFI